MSERISFTSVKKLKEFVSSEAKRIESRTFTIRSVRQLTDARRFLDMLNEPQYANVKKVSELKNMLTKERKKLQYISRSFDKFLPAYQLSLFESSDSVTDEQIRFIKVQKDLIDKKIHWLHKCLGICYNNEYFR